MPKTPAEIQAQIESITEEGAYQLAKFLTTWNGAPKDFVVLNNELRKDGLKPHERVRAMLGSAYDWFAYGN